MRRKKVLAAAVAAACLVAGLGYAAADYDAMIDRDITAVLTLARAQAATDAAPRPDTAALPAPIQRYLAFAFQGAPPRVLHAAALEQVGRFRRPGSATWTPMQAEQYVSAAAPAFVFTATTDAFPGVWARAMDAFVDGRMHMRAKLFGAIPVMAEDGPALEDVSQRRFIIEAALFPSALLPGEHLRWEPMDASRARAVVLADGAPVGAYVVTVDQHGALIRMEAEQDGDPATADRFHGAGEVVERSDYRPVQGVMIPHRFTLSRRLDGEVRPFWSGEVVRIVFDRYARF